MRLVIRAQDNLFIAKGDDFDCSGSVNFKRKRLPVAKFIEP